MNKINIDVPDYIEFISDWKDYTIPFGHCIIDKGITGCGFTEYCLTNQDNIILCSPRRLLLENKVEQHQKDLNICYLQNNNEKEVEYDCYHIEKKKKPEKPGQQGPLINPFLPEVSAHIFNCQSQGLPIKFLVTYDSFHYLLKELGNSIGNYKIVVDEFQSLLSDSTFKADTELGLIEYLQDCPNVCYLSATPMLDKYLDQLDEFKNLDMYVFNWPNSLVERVNICMKKTRSIYEEGKKIINQYKAGVFPTIVTPDKQIHESRELVIYLNSVIDIMKLVSSCKLDPSNTDIICSDTKYNRKRLKKIGFAMSKPNTYENRHLNKMFTFCTRTVYLGADFYSDNASSIVLSNPNKQHLAIDIATDLSQIVGRQRLRGNLFRKKCFFYYQVINSMQTEEDFKKVIQEKMDNSEKILASYELIPDQFKMLWCGKVRDSAQYRHYAEDYVGVSQKYQKPGINKFVLLAESRFWEITQREYLDTINIRRDETRLIQVPSFDPNNQEFLRYVQYFNYDPGNFSDKLKVFCDLQETQSPEFLQCLAGFLVDQRYINYYSYFGRKKLKAVMYRDDQIRKLYNDGKIDLTPAVTAAFQVGTTYPRSTIKTMLGDLYKTFGYSQTPKASDLENWFMIVDTKIEVEGKRVRAYKIIGQK